MPGADSEGNHPFLVYIEDENSATDGDDEPIECGNIFVPHTNGGGGGKP